jgi:pyruvate ferredoxin oxidoreductase beta subunit
MSIKRKYESMIQKDHLHPGHLLCPGCAGALALRYILMALGKNTIAVTGATCLNLPVSFYPRAIDIPSIFISMASTAAGMSGISLALKVLKRKGRLPFKEKVTVFGLAGDGCTGDIGFAAVSGAAERNDDGIYFCFDNEAYMMTGAQRSSLTPKSAWTSSTTAGKKEGKKDLPLIMADHGIPYVATVSVAYPEDFTRKVIRARDIGEGFKYIHMMCPCPTGWRFPEDKTVEISRLAVETGTWILYEVVNGKKEVTYRPRQRRPVKDYVGKQGRFFHFAGRDISRLQKEVDQKWKAFDEEG